MHTPHIIPQMVCYSGWQSRRTQRFTKNGTKSLFLFVNKIKGYYRWPLVRKLSHFLVHVPIENRGASERELSVVGPQPTAATNRRNHSLATDMYKHICVISYRYICGLRRTEIYNGE